MPFDTRHRDATAMPLCALPPAADASAISRHFARFRYIAAAAATPMPPPRYAAMILIIC